jgi:hypothetical protein
VQIKVLEIRNVENCVILGLRRDLNEFLSFLNYYAEQDDFDTVVLNYLSVPSLTVKVGQIVVPKRRYETTLRSGITHKTEEFIIIIIMYMKG